MAVLTGFFSIFGLVAALREQYCCALTFAIYLSINTVANFYVAIQASGLWLYAILHLCVAVVAFSYAKQLRALRHLSRSASSSAFAIDTSGYPQRTIVVPIVGRNEWAVVNQQWMPNTGGQTVVIPPPPYSTHDYTENPYKDKYMP